MSRKVERFITAYLNETGGTALAGDVIRASTAEGYPSSTTRRVASAIVIKTRDGNEFTWSLPQLAAGDGRDSMALSEPLEPSTPSDIGSGEFVSRYAAKSQAERLHLIKARPALAPWHDSLDDLTDSEALVLLEQDDDGMYSISGHTNLHGSRYGASPLPY